MPTPNGYDPKKAAAYNKLIQSGMSEDAAFAQSGITDAEAGNYAIGTNGQLGATVAGAGKVAGVDYALPTAAETAESNRFNQGLASSSKFEEAGYPEKASAPPGAVKPITYTTTSTSTVSGGGSTTIIAGPRIPNEASQALQPAINAKQAEIDQFNKDNPTNFLRKRQGLPPLTPEENQERQEKLDALMRERGALKNQQIDAESTTPPTVITTPNTTTTTQTVTTGTASTNQQVDPETDQKLSQENEIQLDATPSAANATTAREAAPVTENVVASGTPDLVTSPDAAPVAETQPVVASGTPDLVTSPDAVTQPQTTVNEFGQVVAVDSPAPVAGVQSQTTVDEFGQIVAVESPAPVAGVQSQTTVDEFGQIVAVESPAPVAGVQSQTTVDEFGQIVPVTSPAPVGVPQTTVDEFGNTIPNPDFPGNQLAFGENPDEAAAAAEKAAKFNTTQQATLQARYKQPGITDWRVRISLSNNATYLYNDPSPGILGRLRETNGVVFPYTPSIETNYVANYDKYDLVHSNYRGAFYKNSAVNDISIRGTFTAQDTKEAEYMLAVIHFFRSVTKMFYGKDEQRGAPPPLVYLTGFGDYQFAGHPCVVTNFSYSLPSDVDYIRANNPNNYGTDLLNRRAAALSSPTAFSGQNARQAILAAVGIPFGATPQKPTAGPITNNVTNTARATYVPTKIEINVTLLPMQTRDQVSKQFSLKEFANGKLIQGGFW